MISPNDKECIILFANIVFITNAFKQHIVPCVLIHGCFQTRRDEAVVFNLHIAFLTVKGKQRGFINVKDFDVVVDGFQQFVDNPLPKPMVLTAAEIDRLAFSAVGIEVAGGASLPPIAMMPKRSPKNSQKQTSTMFYLGETHI